jgi:hypothetical protein
MIARRDPRRGAALRDPGKGGTRFGLRSIACVTAIAATALALACSGARTEGLDPSKVPENVRADYDLFAQRCSKCHSLARPLSAGITNDEQWVMYVNRMRRQPGSGISYEDQDRILRFLRWYAGELRRKEAEKKAPSATTPSAPSPSSTPAAVPLPTPSPSSSSLPSTSPAPATESRPKGGG